MIEGRDIGSVVFPDATSRCTSPPIPTIRSQRRAQEMTELEFDNVAADIARRDAADQGRADSPLQVSDDSVVLDTTDLTHRRRRRPVGRSRGGAVVNAHEFEIESISTAGRLVHRLAPVVVVAFTKVLWRQEVEGTERLPDRRSLRDRPGAPLERGLPDRVGGGAPGAAVHGEGQRLEVPPRWPVPRPSSVRFPVNREDGRSSLRSTTVTTRSRAAIPSSCSPRARRESGSDVTAVVPRSGVGGVPQPGADRPDRHRWVRPCHADRLQADATRARPRGRSANPIYPPDVVADRARASGGVRGADELTAGAVRRREMQRRRTTRCADPGRVRVQVDDESRDRARPTPAFRDRRWTRRGRVRGRAARRTITRLDQRPQVAEVAGRREVLVLVGDADLLDAEARCECVEHGVDQFLGGRRSRSVDGSDERHPSVSGTGQLVDPVDAEHGRTACLAGASAPTPRVRRVRRSDHDDGVAPLARSTSGRTGDWWSRSTGRNGRATRRRGTGSRVASATSDQSRWDSVVWARSATGVSKVGKRSDLVDRFDPMDGIGGDGHRADGLLVALDGRRTRSSSPFRPGP